MNMRYFTGNVHLLVFCKTSRTVEIINEGTLYLSCNNMYLSYLLNTNVYSREGVHVTLTYICKSCFLHLNNPATQINVLYIEIMWPQKFYFVSYGSACIRQICPYALQHLSANFGKECKVAIALK